MGIRFYSPENQPILWDTITDLMRDPRPEFYGSFYFATIPHWFNRSLFTAIGNIEDGQSDGIFSDQLTDQWSFITAVRNFEDRQSDGIRSGQLMKHAFVIQLMANSRRPEKSYRVRDIERGLLNIHCIQNNPTLYGAVHQRAFEFWDIEPVETYGVLTHEKNRLYHLFFVDLKAGSQELHRLYGQYARDRHLTALAKLIETAVEACHYINIWKPDDNSAALSVRLLYFQARLLQMSGKWDKSVDLLSNIKFEVAPALKPSITRAFGYASANGEAHDYATAIDQFETALKEFESLPSSLMEEKERQVEMARTMLALGDANVGLVKTAQTHEERFRPTQRSLSQFGNFIEFVLSLPLVIYLSPFLRNRILSPHFWHSLRSLDWVIGYFLMTAARHYQTADKILETHLPDEGLVADAQLAFLHLQMGDVEEAHRLFEKILNQEDVPISLYQRARLRVGLGEVYLTLGQPKEAFKSLKGAEPVLRQFRDDEQVAKVMALLGEAALQLDDGSGAIELFSEALAIEEKLNDEEAVTATQAHLHQMASSPTVPLDHRKQAVEMVQKRPTYLFPTRFRHEATVNIRYIASALFFIFGFIIVTWVIQINNVQAGIPDITFAPERLIDPTSVFSSDIGQYVANFSVEILEEPAVLITNAIGLFTIYFVVMTLVGLATIYFTSARRFQQKEAAKTIRFDGQVLQKGDANGRQSIELDDVTDVIISDTYFSNRRLRDKSQIVLVTPHKDMAIPGQTVQYDFLKELILEKLPDSARIKNMSFSFLKSKMGLIFSNTVLFFLLLTFLTETVSDLVTLPLFGGYSLADLHVYIFLGIFLPPLWWFFIYPLSQQHYARHRGNLDYWAFGAGIFLSLYLLLTQFRYEMTVPNIYPPLAAIILTGVGGRYIIGRYWQPSWTYDRDPDGRKDGMSKLSISLVQQPFGRFLLALIASQVLFFTVIIMGSYVIREARISHHVIRGNAFGNRAAEIQDPEIRFNQLQNAIINYSLAIETTDFKILGVSSNQNVSDLYANRGAAYLRMATVSSETTPVFLPSLGAIENYYDLAISDFDKAIDNDDQVGRYYLWKGFAQQSKGDDDSALDSYNKAMAVQEGVPLKDREYIQAQVGIGWIHYQEEEGSGLDGAVTAFEAAVARANDSLPIPEEIRKDVADAHLGLGYAQYAQARLADDEEKVRVFYEEAEKAWQRSAELNPDDPTALFSLGILFWRLAFISEGSTCTLYFQSTKYLEQSLVPTVQTDAYKAFTYRTLGQLHWLRGRDECTDPSTEAYQEALDAYDRAIELDPGNAFYLQMRGRISWSHWQSFPGGFGPVARTELFKGLIAVDQALVIQSEDGSYNGVPDYRPNWARDNLLYPNAIYGSLTRGDEQLMKDNPNFGWTFGYYEPVANYLIDNPLNDDPTLNIAEIAFKTGLAAFGNGEDEAAKSWYAEGMGRTEEGDNLVLLLAYLNLKDISAQYRQPDDAKELLESFDIDSIVVSSDIEQALKARGAEKLAQNQYIAAFHVYEQLVMNKPDDYDLIFNLAFATLGTGDRNAALETYQRAINLALGQDIPDEDAVLIAWNRLHQSELAISKEIENTFQETGISFNLLDDPQFLFTQALELLATIETEGTKEETNDVTSAALVEQGLLALKLVPDLAIIEDAVLKLQEAPTSRDKDAVVALLNASFDQLEQLSPAEDDVVGAAKLGFIALAIGNVEKSAEWYNLAVYRLFIDQTAFGDLRREVGRLRNLWEVSDETGAVLVAILEPSNGVILAEHPELLEEGVFENGRYWRRRAWFYYYFGQAAFLARDAEVALLAIEQGQPAADKSVEFEGEFGDRVNTYLPEAAYGWYHVARGNEYVDDRQYEQGLATYQAAVTFYNPETNRTAKREYLDTLFKIGLMAMYLEDYEAVLQAYEQALLKMQDLGLSSDNQNAELNEAVEDLQAIDLPEADDSFETNREMIIELLTAEIIE